MPRDQVDEIKQKVDIVDLIGSRVSLKKAGRLFKGLCPFHSEKSPSFIVSPERQSFKCFGCQAGGDAIKFLQDYDGMSFLEALEMLAKKVGVVLTSFRPTAEDTKRKRILEVLNLASEYYNFLLTKHESGEVAREYLKTRNITKESIDKFRLGYAPSQWRSVSDFLIRKKGYSEVELEEAGLIIGSGSGKFYDRFRGRVMFPLRDHKGVVVGFSGRILGKSETEAKYINSPETSVYHKSRMLYGLWENREAIRKAEAIVLVEGELDVIPSVQAGVKNVVAIKGSAFTEEQAQLIARYSHNVVMSLDADLAGQEAIKRAVTIADKLDLSIRVVQIKGGKDPGDVASENPRSWREMVGASVLYWDFLIESVASAIDPGSGGGAEKISKEVIPSLSQISNMVVRAHYTRKLAQLLHIPEESVYEEITRVSKKRELTFLKDTVMRIEQGSKSRIDELAIYLLALTLQFYEKIKDKLEKIETGWISVVAVAKIIEKLTAKPYEKLEIEKLAENLPAELLPVLDQAYLRDLTNVEDIKKEWDKTKNELEEIFIRNKLKDVTVKIGKIEKDDGGGITELQQEFGKLSRRLSELSR